MAQSLANGVKTAGAVLTSEPVICNEAPDDEATTACETLGKALTE